MRRGGLSRSSGSCALDLDVPGYDRIGRANPFPLVIFSPVRGDDGRGTVHRSMTTPTAPLPADRFLRISRTLLGASVWASALVFGCSVREEADQAEEQSSMTTGTDAEVVDNSLPAGTGESMPLSVSQAHPNGTTIQLEAIRSSPTETVLTMVIDNQRDTEVTLNGFGGIYLFGPDGAKLDIQAPEQNDDLLIPPGQRVRAELVFPGRLAQGGPATLIVNDGQDMDNRGSRYPGFRIPIDLTASAFFEDGAKKKSSLRLLAADTAFAGARSRSTVTSLEALQEELGAQQTSRGTVVALPGDVLFDTDKADIRSEARGTLDTLARLIAADSGKAIAIEGHTDNRADDDYNQRLSERRAQAVRDYLVSRGNVPATRLTTRGLGESRPKSANSSEAGMQANRRVEVVFEDS